MAHLQLPQCFYTFVVPTKFLKPMKKIFSGLSFPFELSIRIPSYLELTELLKDEYRTANRFKTKLFPYTDTYSILYFSPCIIITHIVKINRHLKHLTCMYICKTFFSCFLLYKKHARPPIYSFWHDKIVLLQQSL